MDKKNIRPPIVTIMGHVDHGKTTLLDAIRKTNVVAGEHGGITQHIGAYQVNFEGKKITFIDTPGHAAFEEMRSRGAEAADVVILVVAATEGVKPQTTEAIRHIHKAKRPIIVAATKTDLENSNIEKVKKELQVQNVLLEEYGGDVPLVKVAALKGVGIKELLEMIELVWQLAPEPFLPNEPMEALVVESFMDKNRGSVSTVIVKKGTLKVGQKIKVDGETITVRALVDDSGKQVKEAEPSKPVEILGFKKVLPIGSIVSDVIQIGEKRMQKSATLEEIISKSQDVRDNFKVIIKADVAGSLEAVLNNLPEKVLVVSSGLGEVTTTDITFAKVASSPILAFNVKIPGSIKAQADREGIVIKTYRVIYELVNDIEDVVEGFKAAQYETKIKGKAKISQTFSVDGKEIAGVTVTSGKIHTGDTIILRRADNSEFETKIASLKKFKKDVESVTSGQECGIVFAPEVDFGEGDVIESLG
ncbi:translation initiation factor IF-2 [Candidatus Curtissbacteria bacterium]|nr:translation initiation factor IF-2 [Candidatus Curtissbacteria bacterium]